MSQDASGGGNLVIEKCAMTDAGVYTARGINDVGDVETSCTVTVTQPMEEPKFTSLLRSAKAVEGSPIKLEGKFFEKWFVRNFHLFLVSALLWLFTMQMPQMHSLLES